MSHHNFSKQIASFVQLTVQNTKTPKTCWWRCSVIQVVGYPSGIRRQPWVSWRSSDIWRSLLEEGWNVLKKLKQVQSASCRASTDSSVTVIKGDKQQILTFKGELRSFEEKNPSQNGQIYNINDVIIQTLKYSFFFHYWINKLFWEEHKVPEHCLKLERWQGPPHVNKVRQCETVSSSEFSLFTQFIESWEQTEFVYLVFFTQSPSDNGDLCLLIAISSPQTTLCNQQMDRKTNKKTK